MFKRIMTDPFETGTGKRTGTGGTKKLEAGKRQIICHV